MKKLFIGIFAIGIAISLSIFLWQQKSGTLRAQEINPQQLKQMIEQGDDFYVYFYSPACPDCIKAEPKIVKAEEITRIKIVKLDIDKYQNIKTELQIPGTPTIYHYKDKKLVSGITGDYPAFEDYVEYFKKAGSNK